MGISHNLGFTAEDRRYFPNGIQGLVPNKLRPYIPTYEYTNGVAVIAPFFLNNQTFFPLGFKQFPKRFFYSNKYKAYLAIVENRPDRLESLLKKGLDCSETLFDGLGMTPLSLAASLDRIEEIDLLLRFSAGIDDDSSKFSKTPLHHAVESGSLMATLLLLNRGANPFKTDQFDYNCYQKAENRHNDEIIKALSDFK